VSPNHPGSLTTPRNCCSPFLPTGKSASYKDSDLF
jgi:hypothetical protein